MARAKLSENFNKLLILFVSYGKNLDCDTLLSKKTVFIFFFQFFDKCINFIKMHRKMEKLRYKLEGFGKVYAKSVIDCVVDFTKRKKLRRVMVSKRSEFCSDKI